MGSQLHQTRHSTSRRGRGLPAVVLSLVALAGVVGAAARMQSPCADGRQRRLLETGRLVDMAIAGEGFFQINDGKQYLYTRNGSFSVDSKTTAVFLTSAGEKHLLEPSIYVPTDSVEMEITPDGHVWVLQEGQSAMTEVGMLQLAKFENPEELISLGGDLYAGSAASGVPLISIPGNSGLGTLQPNSLDASNVNSATRIVDFARLHR